MLNNNNDSITNTILITLLTYLLIIKHINIYFLNNLSTTVNINEKEQNSERLKN